MGCACCERTVSALIVNVKLSCPTIIHPLCVRSDYIGQLLSIQHPIDSCHKSDITTRSDKASRCLGAKDGDCTRTNVVCVSVFEVNSPKMNTYQQYDNTSNTHSLDRKFFFAHLYGPNPTA